MKKLINVISILPFLLFFVGMLAFATSPTGGALVGLIFCLFLFWKGLTL